MTPDDLAYWIARRGFSEREAAVQLGCSRDFLRGMLAGRSKIPRYIGLACSAITHRLPEYRQGATMD